MVIKKILKKILIIFFKIHIKFFDILYIIFSDTHQSNIGRIMLYICQAAESRTKYVVYQVRTKNTEEIPILSGLNQSKNFAIILQGPICRKDDMTINTILFYKKAYPFATIIVSTWNDELEDELDKMKELGVIVIKSEKPSNSGILNVNYQLISSLAGIKRAKELGCEFSVKTRTDQRVCKPYIFDSMISAIKMFPGAKKQKGRVVTLGVCGGGMFKPFFISDLLFLGYTNDLIYLFSAPLDQRTMDDVCLLKSKSLTRRQLSERMIPPEVYILKHYCNDILGYHCEDTVESYWYVVKNYLICYSMKDVDLMWNKYISRFDLNSQLSTYSENDSQERLQTMCFDFFNWFNLYMGNIKYNKYYEKYADAYGNN